MDGMRSKFSLPPQDTAGVVSSRFHGKLYVCLIHPVTVS